MVSNDILQPIPDEKLSELKQLILQDWPSSIYVYNFIDTCIAWKKTAPSENYVTLYSPNGDFSDGTFVAIVKLTLCDIFVYTLDKSLKRLEQALNETKRINWKGNPLFIGISASFLDILLKIGLKNGYPLPRYPLGQMWWLSKEKALEYSYSIPTDVYVAPLLQHHVPIINSLWPHKAVGTAEYLSKLLELNGGIGLFSKENNDLRAWVFKNCFGGLGMLQTDEKCKRKGYATLLIKIFSKMLAENGMDSTGTIYGSNVVSQNLFKSLGYESKLSITWCQF